MRDRVLTSPGRHPQSPALSSRSSKSSASSSATNSPKAVNYSLQQSREVSKVEKGAGHGAGVTEGDGRS